MPYEQRLELWQPMVSQDDLGRVKDVMQDALSEMQSELDRFKDFPHLTDVGIEVRGIQARDGVSGIVINLDIVGEDDFFVPLVDLKPDNFMPRDLAFIENGAEGDGNFLTCVIEATEVYLRDLKTLSDNFQKMHDAAKKGKQNAIS